MEKTADIIDLNVPLARNGESLLLPVVKTGSEVCRKSFF